MARDVSDKLQDFALLRKEYAAVDCYTWYGKSVVQYVHFSFFVFLAIISGLTEINHRNECCGITLCFGGLKRRGGEFCFYIAIFLI